ncbi:hypothetical protein BMF94_3378 [Rhodotorula taiwanensis]|uniref:Uncharacterized protein n=1 Tax=Rhodotorula taiwanensis TaxID=741276 RepID=A0A2S5B9P6_9BASI|nr:hypothetical protein BMF94_3378 [Rhodotorula taiwanensis]
MVPVEAAPKSWYRPVSTIFASVLGKRARQGDEDPPQDPAVTKRSKAASAEAPFDPIARLPVLQGASPFPSESNSTPKSNSADDPAHTG